MNKNYMLLIDNVQNQENNFYDKIAEYFICLQNIIRKEPTFNYSKLDLEKTLLYDNLINYYSIYDTNNNRSRRLESIIKNPLVKIDTASSESLSFKFQKHI